MSTRKGEGIVAAAASRGGRVEGGTRQRVGAHLAALATSTGTWGALVAVLTWSGAIRDLTNIGGGQDSSWVVGLYVAAHDGLHFGSDFVSLLGPLGFLEIPRLLYPQLALFSVLYVTVVHLGVSLSVLWALRRSFPLVLAVPATLIVVATFAITPNWDKVSLKVLIVVFIWCVAMLRSQDDGARSGTWAWVFPPVAAIVTGLELLIEPNVGVTILLMCSITVAAAFPAHRLRAMALFAGCFPLFLLGAWVASGQSLGDLTRFASISQELLSSFGAQQGSDPDTGRWHFEALLVVLAIVAATAVGATRGWSRSARRATWLITAVLLFAAFKESFVRPDEGHIEFFFVAAIGLALGLGWARWPRRLPVVGVAALGALLATWAAVTSGGPDRVQQLNAAFQAAGPGLDLTATPQSLASASNAIQALRSPDKTTSAARQALRVSYALDPGTEAVLRGRGVDIRPEPAAVAWAHPELTWPPAQTPARRVLREPDEYTGSAPTAGMALFCRYVQARVTARWQVLARAPGRCGRTRHMASVTAPTGKPVAIPQAPDARDIVVVRIRGASATVSDRIESFLYRGPSWTLETDEQWQLAKRAPRSITFNPASATRPLIVRIPPAMDYPAAFTLGLLADSITITARPPRAPWANALPPPLTRRLTFDFYAIAVKPAGRLPTSVARDR